MVRRGAVRVKGRASRRIDGDALILDVILVHIGVIVRFACEELATLGGVAGGGKEAKVGIVGLASLVNVDLAHVGHARRGIGRVEEMRDI